MPGLIHFLAGAAAAADPDVAVADAGRLRADGLDAALVVARGHAASWPFTLRPIDPDTDLTIDGTEALAGSIWAGLDGPELAPLAGAWTDAATARGVLRLAAVHADLEPGTYPVLATVESGGELYAFYSGMLRVLPAPGAGADPAGPAYCTYEEVRRKARHLDDGQDPESGRAGMDDRIEEASRWADDVALTRARKGLATSHPGRSYPFDWWYDRGTPDAFLEDVRAALAAGRLDATDARLRRAVVHKVLADLPCPPGQDPGVWHAMHERKAVVTMLGCILRVDLDNDGEYELELTP